MDKALDNSKRMFFKKFLSTTGLFPNFFKLIVTNISKPPFLSGFRRNSSRKFLFTLLRTTADPSFLEKEKPTL